MELLRKLFESNFSPYQISENNTDIEVIAHLDPDKNDYWSPALYELLETTPDKITPNFENFLNSVHKEDQLMLSTQVSKLRTGQLSKIYVPFRLITSTGKTVVLISKAEFGHDKEQYKVYLKDVTNEPIQKEYLLQIWRDAVEIFDQSIDWFQQVFDNDAASIIVIDFTGKIKKSNAAFENLSGFSKNDLSELFLFDIINKNQQSPFNKKFSAFIDTQQTQFQETVQLITKRASLNWVNIYASHLDKSKGYIVCFITDIEAQKKAQNKLKIEQEMLKMAQSMAKIGSWWIKPGEKQIYWSEELYQLMDVDKDFSPSLEAILDLLSANDRTHFTKTIGSFKEVKDMEMDYRTPTSGLRSLRLNSSFVKDASGEITLYYGTVQDITDQMQVNKQLDLIQKTAKLGWYEANLITGKDRWSESLYEILGVDKSVPASFQAYAETIHPDNKEIAHKIMSAIDSGNMDEWSQVIVKHLKSDGEQCYMIGSGTIIKDREDRPTNLIGTMMDITNAYEHQARLKQAQKIAKMAWYEIDLTDRKKHNVSQEFIDICETSKPDPDTDPQQFIDMLADDDRRKYLYRLSKINEYSDGWQNEVVKIITPQNNVKFLNDSAIVEFHNETPVRILGTINDITEQYLRESELNNTKDNLRALITSIEGYVLVMNKNLIIENVFGDQKQKSWFKQDFEPGQRFEPRWGDQDSTSKTIIKRCQRAFITKHSDTLTFSNNKDNEVWLEAKFNIFKGSDDENKLALIVNDVTNRKLAEDELFRSLQKEKELANMQSQFVSMASHQFRTPLTVIKSNMQLLDMANIDHPILSKVSRRLQTEVDRLVNLMQDILNMGQVHSNSIKLNKKSTDFNKLLESLKVDLESGQKDDRTLQLNIHGEPKKIFVDENYLEHALANLVENAFKYSQNKPSPELTVWYLSNKVTISIADHGIGIPLEDRPRLFNSFNRGSNVQEIPGTGLGLAVAKEFIKLNGGTIFLNPEYENGTEFIIQIPYNKES